jgi:hypothetical protein
MSSSHLRNSVGDHPREFGLAIAGKDQPLIYKEKTAGQRDCVDFIGVNDAKRERNLGIGISYNGLAYPSDVFPNGDILNEGDVPLQFGGYLSSDRDLGVKVRQSKAKACSVVTRGLVNLCLMEFSGQSIFGAWTVYGKKGQLRCERPDFHLPSPNIVRPT